MKGLLRNPPLLWLTAATLIDSFVLQSTKRLALKGTSAKCQQQMHSYGTQPSTIHDRVRRRKHSSLRLTTTSTQQNNDDDNIVREKTLQWLNDVVIGMNLCPFADVPMRKNQIQVNIYRGMDMESLLQYMSKELVRRVHAPGTTLIVCPELYPDDFDSYLNVLNLIQQDSAPWEGHVQIAPFHPQFQFQGSDYESADNWTNRSPYPVFHILREDEVTTAVDKIGGDAALVWKRNVELLELLESELGVEAFQQVMMCSQMKTVDLEQKKSDILRRLRLRKNATGYVNAQNNDKDKEA